MYAAMSRNVLLFMSILFINVFARQYIYHYFEGYGYLAVNISTYTQDEAQMKCVNLGGRLAKLRSDKVLGFFSYTLQMMYGKTA